MELLQIKMYFKFNFRPASAQAILQGIGKIIVANAGSGYPASELYKFRIYPEMEVVL